MSFGLLKCSNNFAKPFAKIENFGDFPKYRESSKISKWVERRFFNNFHQYYYYLFKNWLKVYWNTKIIEYFNNISNDRIF